MYIYIYKYMPTQTHSAPNTVGFHFDQNKIQYQKGLVNKKWRIYIYVYLYIFFYHRVIVFCMPLFVCCFLST